MATCHYCKRDTSECDCSLLICHSCESRFNHDYRTIERAGKSDTSFRKAHFKCAEEGWGSNI